VCVKKGEHQGGLNGVIGDRQRAQEMAIDGESERK